MKQLILILAIISLTTINAQHKVELSFGAGHYLHNSENSFDIMKNKKFDLYFLYGITYQNDNIFGQSLRINYNFHRINKDEIFREKGHYQFNTYYAIGNISLVSYNFDLVYVREPFKRLFTG